MEFLHFREIFRGAERANSISNINPSTILVSCNTTKQQTNLTIYMYMNIFQHSPHPVP